MGVQVDGCYFIGFKKLQQENQFAVFALLEHSGKHLDFSINTGNINSSF